MANSEILPFGTGAGSNVVSAAAWATAAARQTGFQAGTASSALVNTALRQSSSVAAMIAQFIADGTAQNVYDDGNLATLEAQFVAALNATVGGVAPTALWHWGRETGGVNALRVAAYPIILAYADGLVVATIPQTSNTGQATLSANGLAAASIVRPDSSALQSGDITAGTLQSYQYDAYIPAWRIIGDAGVPQIGLSHFAADVSTTANSMSVSTVIPAIASVQAGMQFVIKKGSLTNTGAVNLTIGGTTAAVTWADGTALVGQEWKGGTSALVLYDGNYRLLSIPRAPQYGAPISIAATTSGVFTPSAICTKVRVRVWGGGGPGADAPGLGGYAGGGSGGYCEGIYPVTPGVGINYVVSALHGSGANGGLTSFGSFCTAGGGGKASGNTPGTGGTAVGGNILNIPGRVGGTGFLTATDHNVFVGAGAAAFQTSATTNINGGAVASQGAFPGGGGASGNGGSGDSTGGNGAPGLIIIEELTY